MKINERQSLGLKFIFISHKFGKEFGEENILQFQLIAKDRAKFFNLVYMMAISAVEIRI